MLGVGVDVCVPMLGKVRERFDGGTSASSRDFGCRPQRIHQDAINVERECPLAVASAGSQQDVGFILEMLQYE